MLLLPLYFGGKMNKLELRSILLKEAFKHKRCPKGSVWDSRRNKCIDNPCLPRQNWNSDTGKCSIPKSKSVSSYKTPYVGISSDGDGTIKRVSKTLGHDLLTTLTGDIITGTGLI